MSHRASPTAESTTCTSGITTSIVSFVSHSLRRLARFGMKSGHARGDRKLIQIVGTVVALTKKNSNAAELLTFLHKLVSVGLLSRFSLFRWLLIHVTMCAGFDGVFQGAGGGIDPRQLRYHRASVRRDMLIRVADS
jgi:hypothetical protein